MSTFYAPDPILGDIAVHKTSKVLALMELTFQTSHDKSSVLPESHNCLEL